MGKYHLPDGDTLVEELQCLVVYTPKDPVYRQALWGAISQLTKYWMWEPDGAGGEHDAADSWDLAYAQTLESFGMLEELLGYVDEVEDLLRALEVVSTPCCDTDASEGQLFTDDVEDGTGDVPQAIIDAGYATDAADWAGFDDYKCMVSHIVADDIAGKLRAFAPYVDAAGTIAGGIASIIGIISIVYTGGATALFGGILGSTAAAATLYKELVSGDFLSTLANKVDTNHDDLACAIYDGTDGPDAACNALKAEIDNLFTTAEALVLKNLNICATIRALYAGRYDLDNIAQILADKGYIVGDFTCECGIEFDFVHDTDQADVEAGFDGYGNNDITRTDNNPCPGFSWKYAFGLASSRMQIRPGQAASNEGFSTPTNYEAYIVRVEGDVCDVETNMTIRIHYADDSILNHDISSDGTFQFDPPDGPTKPVDRDPTEEPALGFHRDSSGGYALTTIRVYYKIVEI